MNEPDFSSRFSHRNDLRANLKRKSIRGALFMGTGNAAELVVRFGSIAILARILLPEDFGLVFMVVALTSILDGFSYFGFSAATVQRPDISHRQVTNLFWLNVAVGAFLATLIASASPLIAGFYQESRLVDLTIALSFVFVWNGFGVQHQALLIRQLRQGEIAIIRLTASFLSAVIAVVLALNDWGYWSLVWKEIARSVILTAGVWLRCAWVPGLPRRNVGTLSIVRFGGEISLAYLLGFVTMNLDKMLIGRLFGAASVGLYRQAQQLIITPMDQLDGPITGVAQPALSAIQHDHARFRRFYEKIVFIIGAFTVPLGLFISASAEEITLFVLGPTWIEATVFVQIFGIYVTIRPALGTSAIVLVTVGQSTRNLVLTALHAVVQLITLLLAIPWGPKGMAIAFVGTTFLLLYPKLYFSFKNTPASVSGFFMALVTPVVSSFAMLFGILTIQNLVSPDGIIQSLALNICVGSIIYLAVMWLQPRGRRDLTSVFTDVRSAVKAVKP